MLYCCQHPAHSTHKTTGKRSGQNAPTRLGEWWHPPSHLRPPAPAHTASISADPATTGAATPTAAAHAATATATAAAAAAAAPTAAAAAHAAAAAAAASSPTSAAGLHKLHQIN